MVIKNENKIKRWANKLTIKQLEAIILTISSIFDFSSTSSDEEEKQEIELNAFTSRLVSVKDALYWSQEIAKLLNVNPFLVREVPAVISSVPYHNSRCNRIYTRVTKEFSLELRDLYCILGDIKSKKEKSISSQKTIIISSAPDGDKIFLASDTTRCYPFKRKSSQRFRIIDVLFRTKTGKTAREITDFLRKDGSNKDSQQLIKTEIRKINKQFQKETKLKEEIILTDNHGSKNLYFLNRKQFIFEKEK